MTNTVGGVENWLLRKISSFNVPVKRRCFPKESSILLRHALGDVMSVALLLHKSSLMAFNFNAIFVLFPKLIL